MNRKIVVLNLALLALAVALAWQIRERWREAQARERAIFVNAAHAKAVLAPPALTPPRPVPAVEYIDVAQKMLFSKDRNPNVVIEPPAPKPKPPLPALPAYFGQMAIGPPVVLLSANGGDQKSYKVGDKLGPFEIAGFTSETITFVWNDEKIERKLEDLRPKDSAATPAPVARGAASSGPALTASSSIKSIGGAPDAAPDSKSDGNGVMGVNAGSGFYTCKAGDTTPAGTVVNGYKKVVVKGFMGGEVCHWEQAK